MLLVRLWILLFWNNLSVTWASNNRWGRLQFFLDADNSMIVILRDFTDRTDNKYISISFCLKLILLFWTWYVYMCIVPRSQRPRLHCKIIRLKITVWIFCACVCLCFSGRFLTIFLPDKFRMTQLVFRAHNTRNNMSNDRPFASVL